MTIRFKPLSLIGWTIAAIPLGIIALLTGASGALLGGYLAFSADLPQIPDLQAYRPKTVSTFYAEDGSVIGLFFREKRFPVPLNAIPSHVVNAFLAAEDARFFSHPGVDLIGVTRAVFRNFLVGGYAQGASTITQQVTRNFLLSREKKVSRKIREVILAHRLEKTLTKQRILELYLNEIYMGRGSYGIESAARTYFDKPCKDLTIAEAALLAGFVQNPSKFSQPANLDAALKRRAFVLNAMCKHAFISEKQCNDALAESPVFSDPQPSSYDRVPYFTETVRQYIVAKYGEQKLYNEGLQVWTTCDVGLQRSAADALSHGASSWERRQGRPTGLVKRLKVAEIKEFVNEVPHSEFKGGDYVQAVVLENLSPKKLKGKTDQKEQECSLALKGNRKFKTTLIDSVKFKAGDILEFQITEMDKSTPVLARVFRPAVQGAVVCIENHTGYVRSLVGGLDFDRSCFNRATQAMRQPGSAFKPILFAAAMEWYSYGPSTMIIDDPIAVLLDKNQEWLPSNADGSYRGPMTLRKALADSRNTTAVKLLMDVGADATVQMAHNMGIESPLRKHLSLALGASEVTPLELTSAYMAFPNLGVRVSPVLIKKVVDRYGVVLEDHTTEPLNPLDRMLTDEADLYSSGYALNEEAAANLWAQHGVTAPVLNQTRNVTPVDVSSLNTPMPRVLSPQTSYLMLSMMRDVCVSGTAPAVGKLKRRDLTGKTGTTDDSTDAWFVGSNPDYTTGVWIGYDAKQSLGKKEHGSTAALPVWIEFMKEALKTRPPAAYPTPKGILFLEAENAAASVRSDALLEAGADFVPNASLKLVSPVDTVYLPTAAQVDPYTGESVLLAPTDQPQSVRVLSPTGQTVGYGYFARDQRGRTVVYPISQTPGVDYLSAETPTFGAGIPGNLGQSYQSAQPNMYQNFSGWYQ